MLFDLWADVEGAHRAEIWDGLSFPWEVLARLSLLPDLLPTGVALGDEVSTVGAYILADHVFLDRGVVLEPGAVLVGNGIYLGPGAAVRAGAYVRGPVYVGAGGVVGHASEVKGSILLPGAKAPHFNYVGDSVLGRDVNLGAGVKLSNLRLDGREIKASWGGKRQRTGRSKLGALLGDGCSVGCNAVLNPGTVLEPGTHVPPLTRVGGPARNRHE